MLNNVPTKLVTILILIATFSFYGCPDSKSTNSSFIEDNYESADATGGGSLYDKWWKVNGSTEPTTDFPVWASQNTNARSGSDTWRCKECHGWDYVGKNGRYSSGSHYTGFDGVWDQRSEHMEDVFDAIKGEGTDHDLSAELSDYDIADLTKFILEGLFDMSLYLNNGIATGNAANGQGLYNTNCASCHGSDGNTLDFSSSEGVQGVSWLAFDNPQESLHKIRFGHPGSLMPSMLSAGLTDSEQGDILAYAQALSSYITSDASSMRGGLLYDKWWKVNGGTEPTTDFPVWASQNTNARTGSDTWRCKECHGWDYVGKDGRYSSGSHFTGFDGVWDQRNEQENNIFDSIKGMGTNHDLSSVLSDDDIADLTKFILDGLFDMSMYIDNGIATGNANNGQGLYDTNCASCHGLDGNTMDFSSSDGVQGIGWLALDNPQESLHKIRFGHPGSAMPSMLGVGLTDAEQGDILAYGQSL